MESMGLRRVLVRGYGMYGTNEGSGTGYIMYGTKEGSGTGLWNVWD